MAGYARIRMLSSRHDQNQAIHTWNTYAYTHTHIHRIVAAQSSVGDAMWPKRTLEGLISAVKTRVGPSIRLRFERTVDLGDWEQDSREHMCVCVIVHVCMYACMYARIQWTPCCVFCILCKSKYAKEFISTCMRRVTTLFVSQWKCSKRDPKKLQGTSTLGKSHYIHIVSHIMCI